MIYSRLLPTIQLQHLAILSNKHLAKSTNQAHNALLLKSGPLKEVKNKII